MCSAPCGSVPGITDRRQRLVSMLAALYLLSLLLIWVVPHTFVGQSYETALVYLVQYGLPLLPIAIILIRVDFNRSLAPIAVDLFYSVILFLAVAALVLGSFVIKQVSLSNYPIALAQTLFVIAVLLMALSWLWSPHSGFLGLGTCCRATSEPGPAFRALGERSPNSPAGNGAQRFLALSLQPSCAAWVEGVEWETRLGREFASARSSRPTCRFRTCGCASIRAGRCRRPCCCT